MFEMNRKIDRLDVGPARHWAALVLVAVLAVVLARQALVPELPWIVRALVFILGVACVWVVFALVRRGPSCISVTNDSLVDNFGRVICTLDQIEKIDHGAFALKPSKGFLIRLRNPANPGWHPGLWWRYGTRIGVGGMTPAAETKLLAEVLAERFPPGQPDT